MNLDPFGDQFGGFDIRRLRIDRADAKLFVLELAGERLKSLNAKAVKGVVTADKGKISDVVTQPNPETGGWRLSFAFDIKNQKAIELRAYLAEGDKAASEIWIYRWTP